MHILAKMRKRKQTLRQKSSKHHLKATTKISFLNLYILEIPHHLVGERLLKKFEAPVLKVVTTADGPVCFDLTKESVQLIQKGDLLNDAVGGIIGSERIDQVNIPECLCTCTCTCVPVCDCQCTCKCTAKGDSACDALSVVNDAIVEIISPIERTGERIKLNESFMFRQEKFGGLLFDKQNFVSYFCNHTAWQIFQFIKQCNGIPLKDLACISDHLCKNFENVPKNVNMLTFSFIRGCMEKSSRQAGTR